MNRKGFSLIEVMISIAILALISVMVTQTTSKSFQLREDLSVEGEFHNGIKLAMNVVERDITHVFSPLMMMIKPKAGEGQPSFTQSAPNPAAFWGPALDEAGIRSSRFQGQEKKIGSQAARLQLRHMSRRSGHSPGRVEKLEAKSTPLAPDVFVRAATLSYENARRGLDAQDEIEAGRCKAFPADCDWLQT